MTQDDTAQSAQLAAAALQKILKRRKNDDTIRFMYQGAAYDIASREERISVIRAITADYAAIHSACVSAAMEQWMQNGCKGKRPRPLPGDAALLEALANAILDEELTDRNEYKVSHTEYPFLSETQFRARRRRELALKIAEERGVDGHDYRLPTRKRRPQRDIGLRDREAHQHNRRQSAQYMRDTTPGEMVIYHVSRLNNFLST
ncbi:hypothetical protein [Paenibacillus sp. YN15]|uniref:hypothetical protein n=1 Tax=Paenibacillus sp. YN15 TaxID=1742774 RepID=UPI000DCCACB5|nr:hypothetical protein [Paenibacillus sp. YN15]RAV05158.1 hypothetical protein DQG13_04625 [Paenibacillus sp. YN15]